MFIRLSKRLPFLTETGLTEDACGELPPPPFEIWRYWRRVTGLSEPFLDYIDPKNIQKREREREGRDFRRRCAVVVG